MIALLLVLALTGSATAWPLAAWDTLRNPILEAPSRCLKDPSVVYHDGWVYLYVGGQNSRTQDFRTFLPIQGTNSQPDVTHDGTRWVLVSNGGHGPGWGPEAASPLLRTSSRLIAWTAPRPLLPGLTEARNIDPALAWEGDYAYIAFKRNQALYLTRVRRKALGTAAWEPLRKGDLDGAWGEQFQLIQLDGTWHMLATGRRANVFQMLCLAWYPYTCNHHPFLYTRKDAGPGLAAWTRWTGRRELRVPQERWNKAMHANGAYLADWRAHDGHYYLFYAGSADHTSNAYRGHCKIGMARSRDLHTWTVPGGR